MLTLISVFAPLTLSSLIYDELLCNKLVCCVYVGVSSLENQTEADSSDVTERSHDGKPSTGMSVVSDDIYSAVSCLYEELTSEASERLSNPLPR